MIKRLLSVGVALLAVLVLCWWTLYRDTTVPVRIDAEALKSVSLEERASMIADGAVNGGAPGAVLLLQIGEDQVIVTSGHTSKTSDQTISPDTPLRVASISKLYTAAVLVDLHRQGVIDLDQPIATYLPAEVIAGLPNGETATVRQLLNHSAGIPDYYDFRHYFFSDWTKPLTLERTLPVAKRQKAPFPAGEGLEYSNMGYVLAGALAEEVTGETLESLINKTLIIPLGLSSSYYGQHSPPGADLRGYGTLLRPWTETFVFWEHSGPDAGIVASAADVAAVVDALVLSGEGPLNDLGQAMLDQPCGTAGGYQRAQGFEIRSTQVGPNVIGHTGDVMGYLSFAYAIPDADALVVGHITCDCPELLGAMLVNSIRAVTPSEFLSSAD